MLTNCLYSVIGYTKYNILFNMHTILHKSMNHIVFFNNAIYCAILCLALLTNLTFQ